MIGLIFMAMTLWQNDLGYNQTGAVSAPAYLSGADAARWQRLRACRMLYRGQHRQFFLAEGRTQNNYPIELIEGVAKKRYITFNLCKLLSHTTADLMFGATPKITAPAGAEAGGAMQSFIDDLAKRSMLNARLHEAAVQQSWAGGAFLEVTRYDGEVYVEVAPADEIYPQGKPLPNGQYASYVRWAEDSIPGARENDEPIRLVLKTTYVAGAIRREIFQLDQDGKIDQKKTPALADWPAFSQPGAPPQAEESTGIEDNTIVYIPNKLGDAVGVSDYDGLVELQDNVNAKFSQISKILAQHADPKLWFGTEGASPDAQGNVRATDNAFYGPNKPEYITWEGVTETAIKDRMQAALAFCTAAEMSPVLLGIREGATPDAARKLRLEATKDLSKTGRKAMVVQPAIGLLIEVAAALDGASPELNTTDLLDAEVGVQMRDGLPVDPIDVATYIATLRPGTNMSLEGAVEYRVEDPAEAEAEVARINKEAAATAAAATPTVLLGGNPMADAANAAEQQQQQQQDQGATA